MLAFSKVLSISKMDKLGPSRGTLSLQHENIFWWESGRFLLGSLTLWATLASFVLQMSVLQQLFWRIYVNFGLERSLCFLAITLTDLLSQGEISPVLSAVGFKLALVRCREPACRFSTLGKYTKKPQNKQKSPKLITWPSRWLLPSYPSVMLTRKDWWCCLLELYLSITFLSSL